MSQSNQEIEDYSPLEDQLDLIFDVYCDCCNAEFTNTSHDFEDDFLDWVKREADSARRHGWTETKHKVFCPDCDESDLPKKVERDRRVEARKAKAAVLAATRQTWAEKLIRLIRKKFS